MGSKMEDEDPREASLPMISLATFVADVFLTGVPIIKDQVIRQELLGTGNTFTVYAGVYKERRIAIKYFNFEVPIGDYSIEIAEESLRNQLEDAAHEIRIMAYPLLQTCPNVTQLIGVFFELNDPVWVRPALVVDLADEIIPRLADRLSQGHLTPLLARYLVANMFDGIWALHSMKICHGDIKPDNVLLFPSTKDDNIPFIAKISDFGLAFISGNRPRGIGTLPWAAPECQKAFDKAFSNREAVYGRDVYSAALVMRRIIRRTMYPPSHEAIATDVSSEKNAADMRVLVRMSEEIEPHMLDENPERRSWMDHIRKDLRRICAEEGVESYLWEWSFRDKSMTQTEIEPLGVSAQLKVQAWTMLLSQPQVESLPHPICHTILSEIRMRAEDVDDANQADALHALFLCYHEGRLTRKDIGRAQQHLWKAARAGSTLAQSEIMFSIVKKRDYVSLAFVERRDWSIATLMGKHGFGQTFLTLVGPVICERGLRQAIFTKSLGIERRRNARENTPKGSRYTESGLGKKFPTATEVVSSIIYSAIADNDFEKLSQVIETEFAEVSARPPLLQSLLYYSCETQNKGLIFLLMNRFKANATEMDPTTSHSPLSLSIFEDRHQAVVALADNGADRRLFASQLIFGRIVCNSTYTMANLFVQMCHTYYRDEGVQKLLNEGALNSTGVRLPQPLAISILAANTNTLEVLLHYNADVEQRCGFWTPLLLSIARRLPHFCATLIERNARLDCRTTDDTLMGVVHVLADAESFKNTGADTLLYDVFDRPKTNPSESSVSPSQQRRFADHLNFELLRNFDLSFSEKDALGRTPLRIAIESGNIWVAAFLAHPDWASRVETLSEVRYLQDSEGWTLLFYAVEDSDYDLAKRLLQHGLDMRQSSHSGRTILHEAVARNSLEQVNFCLEHNAPPDLVDTLGRTPLILAIASRNFSIVERLVTAAGPQILLIRTAAQENFIHAALKYGADAALDYLLRVHQANEAGADYPPLSGLLMQRDVYGRIPLHYACHQRAHTSTHSSPPNIVFEILALTPNIDAADQVGDTALHDAIEQCHTNAHCLTMARALIDKGASINMANRLGNTPLHYAYQRQQPQGIELLLNARADPCIRNSYGYTPEDWGRIARDDSSVTRQADAKLHALIHQHIKRKGIQEHLRQKMEESRARAVDARQDYVQRRFMAK